MHTSWTRYEYHPLQFCRVCRVCASLVKGRCQCRVRSGRPSVQFLFATWMMFRCILHCSRSLRWEKGNLCCLLQVLPTSGVGMSSTEPLIVGQGIS